ncbi:hypothetical protein JG687_00002222 [Phytophthora cactorum]|uniref:Uncharacterized protein n=1 Tax=Phytophthora cactorum TaxID=29920 RepID=A0A329SEM7_9STRA|nr:hypothetical protein GQ600_19835 [Phytophthora cactorum]KAG2782232.1 hypothetical protein Pcac1_g7591 [Phytophthora cactorum]KAG2830205.1 hypothetical protein PC111_g7473 [Phytophthora cactorum]KAG2832586.1 hypothetical protein PC112_g6834 [Phytophthora cactorum]KAG2859499.1 hypothetical protein PC113_g8886 [Phytophthora cactorum]
MANSSQRMALSANKNKNWRANYLRALNIFTPDLATSTRGRYGPSGDAGRRATANGRAETATSRRRTATTATDETTRRPDSNNSRGRSAVSTSTSARQSSRSTSSSRSRRGASPSEDKTSSYVFGLRSHLFRARRLAPKSDQLVVDRVSAPIEIPTGSSITSPTAIPSRGDKLSDRRDSESRRRRGSSNDFQSSNGPKQPMVQLLSWEEPSVMLGNGGWPLESEKRNSNDAFAIPINRNDSGRSRRPYSGPEGIAEECEDTEDEGLTNTEDDDDDIFKMEFEGEGSDSNASSNVFRGKRAAKDKRRVDLRQWRPGGFDDFDDDEEDDVVTPLSASFVPPHQMVERGCFSLGLRDELKRKPGMRS